MTRFSRTDLQKLRAAGESRTDLARIRGKSEEQLERDIAQDADWSDIPHDWVERAAAVIPSGKKLISLRLDNEVIDWFKNQGAGYQTKINGVLRVFMQESKRARRRCLAEPTSRSERGRRGK